MSYLIHFKKQPYTFSTNPTLAKIFKSKIFHTTLQWFRIAMKASDGAFLREYVWVFISIPSEYTILKTFSEVTEMNSR